MKQEEKPSLMILPGLLCFLCKFSAVSLIVLAFLAGRDAYSTEAFSIISTDAEKRQAMCSPGMDKQPFLVKGVSPEGVLISNAQETLLLATLAFSFTERPDILAFSSLRRLIGKTLLLCGVKQDRFGRLIAGHVLTTEGNLALDLLSQGVARFSGRHYDADLTPYLTAEDAAYTLRRGAWGKTRFTRFVASNQERVLNGFQIIMGTVKDVAKVRDTLFINFGDDWRTDVTVGVIKPTKAWLRTFKINTFEALIGRRVEARGVVRRYNGPYLEVHSHAQIRLLPSPIPER